MEAEPAKTMLPAINKGAIDCTEQQNTQQQEKRQQLTTTIDHQTNHTSQKSFARKAFTYE